ncbi:MAG: ubiquitin-like small modifier protein 1 [Anaerolineales bacterium]|nr:MoaD/ThiS family protein [Anaerolineales bacterium]MCS7247572.1 MoaD/ThiS family protein [Anaerolineales bacterium]MDW8161383.1 ubiquitin-like small modifier protein 1 [Anaerolineales bacterium]MDW8447992.1 ubiquitin-like small modifier protein 1 [Anaerolineales bacterium]
MAIIRIPTPLRPYTNGQSELTVAGETVGQVLENLVQQYPALRTHIFNENGELRPFVNLFIGENNVNDLQGVATPVEDNDRILLIPSIAGG